MPNHDHDDVMDDDRFIASGVCRLSVEVQLDDHAAAGESPLASPEPDDRARENEGTTTEQYLHAELS
jgi:hypothetical protein